MGGGIDRLKLISANMTAVDAGLKLITAVGLLREFVKGHEEDPDCEKLEERVIYHGGTACTSCRTVRFLRDIDEVLEKTESESTG